jgi:hypothetical protein
MHSIYTRDGARAASSCVAFLLLVSVALCPLAANAQQPAPGQPAPAASAPPSPPERPLADLIREAAERFTPPGEQELAEARAEVVRRANELEGFVRPNTANGRRWLSYLRWADLREQMAEEGTPNLAPLMATYQQLNRDEVGLELPQFRRMSDALRRYVDRLVFARASDPAAVYSAQLTQLATDLERIRSASGQPTGDGTLPISFDVERRLDLIAGIAQSPELLAAIRREYVRPNAFLHVSSALVRAAAEEPINRRDPVTDNILGTSIHGDGHTTGRVTARTLPSTKNALIELVSSGHVESHNTGRNGPAVIRSTGHTDFNARKVIELSDRAFQSQPARVTATTRSDIHSVAKAGGGIGSRMVSSQGMSQARQKQGQANAIAADHAEDRIRRRIDDEVAKKLRDARKRYDDEYRLPLARRGELPEDIRFASTESAVTISATQASRGQLGALAPPPEAPADLDLTLRLHASAINNYAATLLGGATASETEPGQDGAKFDVKMPKWMKDAWDKRNTDKQPTSTDAAEFKPWSLTFRPGRPITVSFAGGKVSLTIHLARMSSGSDQFTNWDVTGVFVPKLADGGVMLEREGDLTVFPTNFDRTSGNQLSSREVAERGNITKVLNERSAQGRGFPNRIEFGRLEPTGALENVGHMDAKHLTSDGGWLTVAWHRRSAESKQADRRLETNQR